ncbi:unnamed protein product [Rhizophagus irregularis]|nr:unnamed protein product [Rhizophagus irregularis]
MASYRGQEEFKEQLLKDVKSFVEKNFKNAEFQKKDELEQSFDKIFFRTLKTHRLLTEISDITGIKGENVEILARKSEIKAPIKSGSEQRKTPKNKKREQKSVKEIVLPTKADQDSVHQNLGDSSTTSRDILFYDIPARYNDIEVVEAIKQLGTVHRIRIKKHYKYQSVRADISLLKDYEQSFLKGAWKEKVLIGSNKKNKKVIEIRWFNGDKTVVR